MKRKVKGVLISVAAMALLAGAGCSVKGGKDAVRNASRLAGAGVRVAQFDLTIIDQVTNQQVCSTSGNRNCALEAGKTYVSDLVSADVCSAELQFIEVGSPLMNRFVRTVPVGRSSFPSGYAGVFEIVIRGIPCTSDVVESSASLQSNVTCTQQTVADLNVTASGLQVSVAGVNQYTINALGALSGGQNPIMCRFDVDGNGIFDTPLENAGSHSVFAQILGTHTVGVLCVDACGRSDYDTAPHFFDDSNQNASPQQGINYVRHDFASPAGMTFGAQQPGAPVQASLSGNQFLVTAMYQYGESGQASLGCEVTLAVNQTGAKGQPGWNVTAGNTASLSCTFQSPGPEGGAGSLAPVNYSVTLSNQLCQLKNYQGTDCDGDNSLDVFRGTVECSGNYTGGGVTNGAFNGTWTFNDGCPGSGGQGSGGTPPYTG